MVSEKEFLKELENIINRNSMENRSDTPDFIIAEFLKGCLDIFDRTVNRRSDWYGPGTRLPNTFDRFCDMGNCETSNFLAFCIGLISTMKQYSKTDVSEVYADLVKSFREKQN